MKKITLSLVSIVALSGLAFAGGDIAPVVEEPVVVLEDNSVFYIGLGYGYFNQTVDNVINSNIELESNSVMLQAGYQYNQYIAFEGRYWIGIGDITQNGGINPGDKSGDYDAWGLYLEPIYPVTQEFDVYGLLGYADTSVKYDSGEFWNTDGFSWGIGAQYAVTENILIFVDYLNMGSEDSVDLTYNNAIYPSVDAGIDLYTVNVGVSYKF
ncbi:MAG TPA: porin family protein [bacterium (Candidatus Stahlbacteria)]|nr:porin family protein [Candidatus Stahlbacteria bacterium]